jgi:hypothetical protein
MRSESSAQHTEHPRWLVPGPLLTGEALQERIKLASPPRAAQIIGCSGPGRSGSTALMLLFAGLPYINRVHFQPIKTQMRQDFPPRLPPQERFLVLPSTGRIFIKETFGPSEEENFDPIAVLLRAGIPAENITWFTLLRDPAATYSSYLEVVDAHMSPELFATQQAHALGIFRRYASHSDITMVPFAYDLLRLGEMPVLTTLLDALGLPVEGELSLKFSPYIYDKTSWWQAWSPEFRERLIQPARERGQFMYVRPIPEKYTDPRYDEVNRLCRASYDEFYELSRRTLGLK